VLLIGGATVPAETGGRNVLTPDDRADTTVGDAACWEAVSSGAISVLPPGESL